MVSCTTMKEIFEKERIEEIRKSGSANVLQSYQPVQQLALPIV